MRDLCRQDFLKNQHVLRDAHAAQKGAISPPPKKGDGLLFIAAITGYLFALIAVVWLATRMMEGVAK